METIQEKRENFFSFIKDFNKFEPFHVKRSKIIVALYKSVTLNWTLFVGGWGGGPVVQDTVVDGIFLPRGTQWDQ